MTTHTTERPEDLRGRLAEVLRERRAELQLTHAELARRSGWTFDEEQLATLEEGAGSLQGLNLGALLALYGLEPDTVLSERAILEVDRDAGVLRTAGFTTSFEPDNELSLLTAYLRLVRDLRGDHASPAPPLRADDVEVLAKTLGLDSSTVTARLSVLMGVTVAQPNQVP